MTRKAVDGPESGPGLDTNRVCLGGHGQASGSHGMDPDSYFRSETLDAWIWARAHEAVVPLLTAFYFIHILCVYDMHTKQDNTKKKKKKTETSKLQRNFTFKNKISIN